LVEEGDYEGALAILDHLVELYPGSMNGPWQLANLHREMGDTVKAIQYYEECLRRDPNMVPARQWLERLRGFLGFEGRGSGGAGAVRSGDEGKGPIPGGNGEGEDPAPGLRKRNIGI
jgi:tetratricopeptide (TPR) repeat protein